MARVYGRVIGTGSAFAKYAAVKLPSGMTTDKSCWYTDPTSLAPGKLSSEKQYDFKKKKRQGNLTVRLWAFLLTRFCQQSEVSILVASPNR